MGCGCSKASTTSIQRVSTDDPGQNHLPFLHRGVTEEQRNQSSLLRGECVPRFTRKSEYEDFFERSPVRPNRNSNMMDVYVQSNMNSLEYQGKPKATLQMEYIYGYRCFLSRQNLFYTSQADVIAYPAASVIVLLNKSGNNQSFLGGGDLVGAHGHSDDVVSLAINGRRDLLASGEIGTNPLICVWKLEAEGGTELKRIDQGTGTCAVAALCFSDDSKHLLAIDKARQQAIRIYEWKESSTPIHTMLTGAGRASMAAYSPKNLSFCTVGREHFSFWTFRGHEFVKHAPNAHDKSITMNVLSWFSNGNCVTGGSDGKLYLWIDRALKNKYQILEEGCEVYALTIVSDVIVVAGQGHIVFVLNATFKEIGRFQVPDWVYSLDKNGDSVLCGTRNGIIQELTGHGRAVLMESHCEREVWSIAVSPKDWNVVISAGDDNKIKMWDLSQKRCVSTCILEAGQGSEDREHRVSLLPLSQQSRALCVSPRGHVAVAHNDGKVTIRNNVHQLNLILRVLSDTHDWILKMQYSPKGTYLAVGSHDSIVYIYDVVSNYTLFHRLIGHKGAVISIDWNLDETIIKTCDFGGELLFWEVENELQIPEPSGEQWASWTSSSGDPVRGINQVTDDSEFISCVSRSPDLKKFVVGNSWGLLEVYDNPNFRGCKSNIYRGHSREVINVLWTKENHMVVSVGGSDLAVIQWKVVEKKD